MKIKIFIILTFLFNVSACDRFNTFRIVNLSESEIIVRHAPTPPFQPNAHSTSSIAAGITSRSFTFGNPRLFSFSRADQPGCLYRYTTIDKLPIPEGRRVIDWKSPQTMTLIVIDKDFITRAYVYEEGKSWEQSIELRSNGFPARLTPTCEGG